MTITSQPDYQIYEYGCHEGNIAMRNALTAERAYEKAAEEAKAKGLPPPERVFERVNGADRAPLGTVARPGPQGTTSPIASTRSWESDASRPSKAVRSSLNSRAPGAKLRLAANTDALDPGRSESRPAGSHHRDARGDDGHGATAGRLAAARERAARHLPTRCGRWSSKAPFSNAWPSAISTTSRTSVTRLDVLHLLTLREADGLGSFLGGRVRLFPHQLYVAERATASLTRCDGCSPTRSASERRLKRR